MRSKGQQKAFGFEQQQRTTGNVLLGEQEQTLFGKKQYRLHRDGGGGGLGSPLVTRIKPCLTPKLEGKDARAEVKPEGWGVSVPNGAVEPSGPGEVDAGRRWGSHCLGGRGERVCTHSGGSASPLLHYNTWELGQIWEGSTPRCGSANSGVRKPIAVVSGQLVGREPRPRVLPGLVAAGRGWVG